MKGATRMYGLFGVVAAGLTLVIADVRVDAQSARAMLAQTREALMRRLPAASEARIAAAEQAPKRLPGVHGHAQVANGDKHSPDFCSADSPNPLSSLVAREDNPRASALEGFVLSDRRGRRTRPWRAFNRAERAERGRRGVIQRPLLVFLETPTAREDFTKPWFGPVRFDRPGFYTTKEAITEQVFGKDFDYRDPASVAGFYYRESGGQLIIRGDPSSVHTVLVPHMTYDPAPMVEAILAQLDPTVDFTRRADELGWVDPIFIMTPYAPWLDVYDPSVMGGGFTYLGYGPTVYDLAPAITNDTFPDGSHAALSTLAISMVGSGFGANQDPTSRYFGVPEDQVREDVVELYAHEYGHALGMSHMFTQDYALDNRKLDPKQTLERISPLAFNRLWGSGFATSVMNYSYGSGLSINLVPPSGQWKAGLDPINRAKLGWGNVVEVTLADEGRRRGPRELPQGAEQRLELVEHLGQSPHDPRPQILKVNLPPQQISLFPQSDGAGNPSGYWRPGGESRRMVWSGRTYGGSRTIQTRLRIPHDLTSPVLSFWTKYGAHSGGLYPPGYEHGWVQVSLDNGESWTSLAGQTSSTYVDPFRAEYEWFGQDLGAPAFTGDSRLFGVNGWIFEQVPLPVPPGRSFLLRFNFIGYGLANENELRDFGWWIDDVYLGTPSEPTRHLVSDFEGDDANQWRGLLPDVDQAYGFVIVEETAVFPQAYFFELRGSNAHDDIAFREPHPKEITGPHDKGLYTYEKGLVGYFADHFSTFWAGNHQPAGSATHRPVPIERLRRFDVGYPHHPQGSRVWLYDFGFLLALASDPTSGLTLDDVVFLFTLPWEQFDGSTLIGPGYALPLIQEFPLPAPVTILDATPTYRPLDVQPVFPQTPFPERPLLLWPYVLGAPGGWPKTLAHGLLGLDDPTTTRVLGQPFLARDAAFHPERNAVFDDAVDYRGGFMNEFAAWHGGSTEAALASSTPAERIKFLPTSVVPVSETESIQNYLLQYCARSAAGTCVAPGAAIQRSWIEQMAYERLAPMLYFVLIGACPASPPDAQTLETKPAWDAFYACVLGAADNAHQQTEQLLTVARNLGQNPAYSWLNFYGDTGTLSPALWTEFYLEAWGRAKGPAPLPSVGLSVEVERITSGPTPTATLRLRRSGGNQQTHTP